MMDLLFKIGTLCSFFLIGLAYVGKYIQSAILLYFAVFIVVIIFITVFYFFIILCKPKIQVVFNSIKLCDYSIIITNILEYKIKIQNIILYGKNTKYAFAFYDIRKDIIKNKRLFDVSFYRNMVVLFSFKNTVTTYFYERNLKRRAIKKISK